MNKDTFREWLEGVLPKLKDKAVIVMDNTSYHLVKLEKCQTRNWRKADIIEKLKCKGEVIDNTMIIVELLEVVEQLKPAYNKYVIDEMVSQDNKTILQLPPYHCDHNPIELGWSVVKQYVKANNKMFKIQDVRKLFCDGIETVDGVMWNSFITHTIKEDKLWNLDNVVDELIAEQCPIAMTIGNNSKDNDLDGIDFLPK